MSQDSLFENQPEPGNPPKRSREAPGKSATTAHIDGGARGNPGPSAYGVVVRDERGKIVAELGQYLGIQTNNFAEYSGLLAALEYAATNQVPALKVFSDSELLVKQMKGIYKVKSPGLKELYDRARQFARRLQYFSIEHVLREYNRDADRLVNKVLDERR